MPRQSLPLSFASANAGGQKYQSLASGGFQGFPSAFSSIHRRVGFYVSAQGLYQEQDHNGTPKPLASRRVFALQMFHVLSLLFVLYRALAYFVK